VKRKPKPAPRKPAPPAKPKRKRLKTPLRNKQRAFLAAIAITGSIKQAAEDAKVGRTSHYKWMDSDPAYPARFAKAMAQGDDAYEDEVSERAYKGVFEPLVFQGQFSYEQIPCMDPGTGLQLTTTDPTGKTILKFERGEVLGVWKKSDALLMFRQRGRFPDRYANNKVAVTGELEITDPDDAKRELVRLVAGLAAAEAAKRGDSKPE
jgi:hypothetical protein